MKMVIQLYDTVLFEHNHRSAVDGSPMSTAPNFSIIAGIAIPVALVYQVEPVATAFGTANYTKSTGAISVLSMFNDW